MVNAIDLDGFVRVWKDWDRRPRRRDTANAMESACKMVAKELGMTTSQFRDRLIFLRRRGVPHAASIRILFTEHGVIRT